MPVGRLLAEDLQDLANICENFGDKEIRLTEDQNIIITGIDTTPKHMFVSRDSVYLGVQEDTNESYLWRYY